MLPLYLVLLMGQHATSTLAARGRHALLILSPTGRAHAGPTLAAPFLALTTISVLVGWAVPQLAAAAPFLVAGWAVWALAHPCAAEAVLGIGAWRKAAPYRGQGVVLVHSLIGRGRPSVPAFRLVLKVGRHVDERGWTLVTNSGVRDDTGAQYGWLGFRWLPDGSRRMLRPASRAGERAPDWPRADVTGTGSTPGRPSTRLRRGAAAGTPACCRC